MPDDLRGMMNRRVPCGFMRHIAWTCLALVLTASTATAQDGEELPPIDAIVASQGTEDGAYWNVTAEDLSAYPAVARAVAQPDYITNLEEGELASTHAFFDQVMQRDALGIRLDGKTYSVGITLAHALPPPSTQSDDAAGKDSPGPAAVVVLAAVAGVAAALRRQR